MLTQNCYEDTQRAEAYSRLEFPGTYFLAYRDFPRIIAEHVRGKRALDFGCGTGRSARFLGRLGFDVTGVDIAREMIEQARVRDPQGDYRLVQDGDLSLLDDGGFDLALSVFTFDNIPTRDKKTRLFRELARVLAPGGKIVSLVSSPEVYLHEWASFSTKDFPENAQARCGDKVRIIITDIADARPVEDYVWPDADYRAIYDHAGLEVVETHKPLARADEPFAWVNETRIAPWTIYVLERRNEPATRPGA
jgi:SAM-dependent methyltransferase